eukprot:451641_1
MQSFLEGSEDGRPFVGPVEDRLDVLLATLKSEEYFGIIPEYLSTVQRDGVGREIRGKVIRWILECCDDFDMERNTAYTAVVNFDRFMAVKNLTPSVVQLVAVASILVSAKLHEFQPPVITELWMATNKAYLLSDFRAMEIYLLEKLNWRIRAVNPHRFLRILLHAFPLPEMKNVFEDAEALVDMAFGNYAFVTQFRASVASFASSILALEQYVCPRQAEMWVNWVQSFCQMDMSEVDHCKQWYRDYYTRFLNSKPQIRSQATKTRIKKRVESPSNVADLSVPMETSSSPGSPDSASIGRPLGGGVHNWPLKREHLI